MTRAAKQLRPARVIYTPWCDEDGKVIDDGTVAALDDGSFRWTAADPQLRWLELNARGLDVEIEETTERVAAVALQGPRSRAVLDGAAGAEAPFVRGPRLLPASVGDDRRRAGRRSRTGLHR